MDCSIDDCPRTICAKGLCSPHYQASRTLARIAAGTMPICEAEGCLKYVKSRGLCPMHYQRVTKSECLPCKESGCAKPARSRGLCQMHYHWQYVQNTPCTIEGCDKPNQATGLCAMHYYRLKNRGSVGSVDRDFPKTNGLTPAGYIVTTIGGRKRMTHRVIMEAILGRFLWPDENVHHINGQRGDNRPENLELWSTHQPAGQRVVDKIAWAKEILARYEPDQSRSVA